MEKRVKTRLASDVMKVVVLAILCLPAMRATAQEKPKVAPADDVKALAVKPTPKAGDHPDLSGRWVGLNLGVERRVGATEIGGRIDGKVHDLYFGTPIPGADPEKDAI